LACCPVIAWFVILGLPHLATAQLVTVTITGTVEGGFDQTGVFGFAPNSNLAGQDYTLVFTIDGSKGQQGVYLNSYGAPDGSYIENLPWLNPVEYPSGPTGTVPLTENNIVLQATFPSASGRQQWTIKIPLQPDTNGNFSFYGLNIYVPIREGQTPPSSQ
jgi:hypothetical protein